MTNVYPLIGLCYEFSMLPQLPQFANRAIDNWLEFVYDPIEKGSIGYSIYIKRPYVYRSNDSQEKNNIFT